ncbi:MAG: transcriptional regulator [Flavobacteriaceae bacterium]|nr:transcriptional regulator [Flavobacteriaceae bacterium]
MGITKTIGFSEETNQMAEILKALGNPARLEIVKILMKSPNCICGNIVELLPLAQSTVSRHLSYLKKAGIIKGAISGNSICYCLDENTIKKLQNFISIIQLNINGSECC